MLCLVSNVSDSATGSQVAFSIHIGPVYPPPSAMQLPALSREKRTQRRHAYIPLYHITQPSKMHGIHNGSSYLAACAGSSMALWSPRISTRASGCVLFALSTITGVGAGSWESDAPWGWGAAFALFLVRRRYQMAAARAIKTAHPTPTPTPTPTFPWGNNPEPLLGLLAADDDVDLPVMLNQ